jgi:hypothetical protein
MSDLIEKLNQYRAALNGFLERLREDRNILAAVLVGSLSEETIWRRDSIHLWIIEADGVSKRLKADGKDERIFRILVEEGVNVHAELIPRSRFRQMVEGSSRTAFSCSFFASRELVYCADKSIEKWFKTANTVAAKDQQRELLRVTTWAIWAHRHASRRFDVKLDLQRCKEAVIWVAHAIAAMEQIKAKKLLEEDTIYWAIEQEPDLFEVLYLNVISKKPSKKNLKAAIDAAAEYLDSNTEAGLKPVVQFLKKQRRVIPLSELSEHFAYTQVYPGHLEESCDWLEESGLLEKVSTPFKLTKKSRTDVEEPAFEWAGG